jgi:integrase
VSEIKEAQNHRVHPDTLGMYFAALMKKLKLPYQMHDLRRTFITKVLELNSPKQVMLAVGHANIETTMKYIRDDRAMDDSIFVQ